jgi:tetratricopeptide (TPR) repeat protein
VVLGLTAALDDWAGIRRVKRNDYAGAMRLRAATRVADPDPWRNELRGRLDDSYGLAVSQRQALQALAKAAKFEELGPVSLQLLGSALNWAGDSRGAESVLRRAQQLYPRDVWVNHELGKLLEHSRLDEAIRFYTAARALRPETAHELAHALERRGDLDESIAVHRELNELRPGNATILGCLGRLFKAKGLSEEASAAFEAAKVAERETERLRPATVAYAHSKLAIDLAHQGKYEEVIAELRTVKRLDPNRRFRWPNPPRSQFWMTGTLDESIAEYTYILGNSLKDGSLLDKAKAIAAYRKAIQLRPELVKAYSALVVALKAQGKLDEVVEAYREAIRLEPDNAVAHFNLGGILRARGDFAGSLALVRRGHELGSKQPGWPHPSAKWVSEAERRAALAERLTVVLKGESSPKDNAERLDLALLCYDTKRFAAAARLTAEALESDPKLGEDLRARHRHNAACYAALAGVGQGEDDPRPGEAATNRLRTRARAWFRADLGLFSKRLEANDRDVVLQALVHWKECGDLAGIRDATAVSKLPEPEQKEWQSLWAEVEALLNIVVVIDWHNLGNDAESQRQLDAAITKFRSAIQLKPDHAEAHYGLGNVLNRQGNLDEAIAEYREAIRLDPHYADGHYGLGSALNRQGKLDEAIAEYRAAIRLEPNYAEAHRNLGNALDRQGKKDEAIAECREAIRLKPDHAEAYYNLGGLLKSRGDDAGALEMYRKWHELVHPGRVDLP